MESAALSTSLLAAADSLLAQRRDSKSGPIGLDTSAAVPAALLSNSSAMLMELRALSDTLDASVSTHEKSSATVRERVAEVEEQLRMLKYQRARLRRAIAACTEGGEAATGLLAELQRLAANHPDDESCAGLTQHQRALRQLGAERDERARLCAKRDALATRRAALADSTSKAVELKASVDQQLETVAAAAAPLRTPMPAPPSYDARFSAASNARLPELPSPLYTLALTAAAYMVSDKVDATLEVIENPATASPTKGVAKGAGAAKGAAKGAHAPALDAALDAAHPLALRLALRSNGVTAMVTFTYHPTLEVLAASATPPAADAALRGLATLLPANPPAAGGLAAAEPAADEDTGSRYPDLCATLRARRQEAATATWDPSNAHRPFKWLQWLGGLGPLLTTPPQPSHVVLDVLVRAVTKALAKRGR